MKAEQLGLSPVLKINELASAELAIGREERVDPITSPTHPDHWLVELPGYVMADIARGEVGEAQDMVRYWLDRTDPAGRAPHMIVDNTSWRRRHIDRRVQMADKLENGALITPFSGPPVLASCALQIADALPEGERGLWAAEVLPKLQEVKRYHYQDRDISWDGLPVQIHPDEVLLRHGRISDAALAGLPDSKLTDFEHFARNIKPMQRIAKAYRNWQGDDSRHIADKNQPAGSYDSDDFMQLDTASRIYTLLWTARKKKFDAEKLAFSTGRGGVPDGYIVQDPAITGMLLNDNQALNMLTKMAGEEMPLDIQHSIDLTIEGAKKHWDETTEKFAAKLPMKNVLLPNETGIEAQFLALLGGRALSETQVDQVIHQALMIGDEYPLMIPTAAIQGDHKAAGRIDRGGFSSPLNLFLYKALDSYTGYHEAAVLRRRIGQSIVSAYQGSELFSRQYNSMSGRPMGQSVWRPTAAAVTVVTRDMLAS